MSAFDGMAAAPANTVTIDDEFSPRLQGVMTAAVVVIFAFVNLGMAMGRLAGLALDRTGVALLGAIAVVRSTPDYPRRLVWWSRGSSVEEICFRA